MRIPRALLDIADMREGDQITISATEGQLVVRRARVIDIDAMIDAIHPDTLPDTSFDAPPIGRELL